MKLIKKIWKRFLDFIAWMTKDNARIRKAKRLTPNQEMEIERARARNRGPLR
jgi:hypothetical protein